jgi:ABC-type multidrug transport system fused ATPase/permease subunit
MFKDKRAILAVSLLALFSLVALAGAMGNFTFRPARHFSSEEAQVIRLPVGDILESIESIPLEKQIAFIVMVVLFVVLSFALLSPEMRKRLFRQLLNLAAAVFVLYYFIKEKPGVLEEMLGDPVAIGKSGPITQPEFAPPPVFQPPQISGWISFLVALGVVLLFVLLFWRINRWWTLHMRTAESTRPLDEIAKAARRSLHNLSAGDSSVHDRIIQCYSDMSRVVSERQGLRREYAMTPSEFAERLENAGLPREPVSRLTRLFEAVRYGARTSTQNDIDEAVDCLTSILKYCGEAVS